MAWQNASGYNKRARAEATMNRWKQVIGDDLRAHTDERRAEAVRVSSAKPVEYGWRGPRWRSPSTRSAWPDPERDWGQCAHTPDPCTTLSQAAGAPAAACGPAACARASGPGQPRVNQRRSGIPFRKNRNPLSSLTEIRSDWGPDRRRSGPPSRRKFPPRFNHLRPNERGVPVAC